MCVSQCVYGSMCVAECLSQFLAQCVMQCVVMCDDVMRGSPYGVGIDPPRVVSQEIH